MSEFVIGRRQLYILPTRIGWYYAMILLALLAIAVKFNNQPAYMMMFVLTSIGLVAMLYTHQNVVDLQLSCCSAASVFVGANAEFPLRLKNHSNKQRRAIWLVCDGFHQLLSLQPQQAVDVILTLPALSRGYLTCSPVILTSQFPIGLFFCWSKRYFPQQSCLVYPQPRNLAPLPPTGAQAEQPPQAQVSRSQQGDEYSGMQPYQPGDRLRDVHWPSLAKSKKLVTIQHQDQSGDSARLSWFDLPASWSVEDRLGQLCQWVIDAHRSGIIYQLQLPGQTQDYSHGDQHYHRCLALLALWNPASGESENIV